MYVRMYVSMYIPVHATPASPQCRQSVALYGPWAQFEMPFSLPWQRSSSIMIETLSGALPKLLPSTRWHLQRIRNICKLDAFVCLCVCVCVCVCMVHVSVHVCVHACTAITHHANLSCINPKDSPSAKSAPSKPSCLQNTLASSISHPLSHTVPHSPLYCTSTRPALILPCPGPVRVWLPFTIRTGSGSGYTSLPVMIIQWFSHDMLPHGSTMNWTM